MATETWFYVKKIIRHTENDGWAYSRKGPEANEAEMAIEDAIAMYGPKRIADNLREVARDIERGGYTKRTEVT